MVNTIPIDSSLIAPCGADCGVCIGHLRTTKQCPGCVGSDEGKPKHCVACRIKHCPEKEPGGGSCPACPKFPCARLRQLDKRYRTNYGTSLLDNLRRIKAGGVEAFVAAENVKWSCSGCGARLSIHRGECLECGKANPYFPASH